ncbi:MAG: tRNA A-37 threonylcarbamoyl transferase component Bud32 [Parasphingorhabdus sp.]
MKTGHSLFGAYSQHEFMLRDDTRVLKFQNRLFRCELVARYDTPALRTLLLNLDREIQQGSFTELKHDGTTTVGFTSRDGRKLLIKRYNTKNTWHAIRRLVRRSRAENCFEKARLLRKSGINTPAPIAMVEQRLGSLRGRSWFISEFVEGPSCLDFIHNDASPTEARNVASHLEWSFRKLSKLKISHGDMKATNIILRNNRAPWLIDLDGMRQHKSDATFEIARKKDRARFLQNWQSDARISGWFERITW